MKNVLCTICMRGGSKGVANKNILKINNKPLLYYTIKQAIKSKLFDNIIVSTDSLKIANLSTKFGAKCWFKRPQYLSDDKAGKLNVIKHALLESEKHFNKKFDIIVDLDATAPLRNVSDIQKAYNKFVKDKSNNLITATIAKKNPYFNQIQFKKNKYDVVVKQKTLPKRRQDAPKVYDMNASIYIWRRNFLLKSNNIFTSKTSLFIMPPERSCDIDNKLDFKFVEYMMKRKNRL